MDTGNIIALAAMGLAFVAGYIKLREGMAEDRVKLNLLWDAFKEMAKDAAKILHTPHPENERRDVLLEKFVEGIIKREELKELITLLKDIIDNNVREFGERTAASNLLRVIQMQYQV